MATNESPTQIPKPERPLKILTLDGGGLQAISTLVILDSLLDSIAETNATNIKPRPCDIFDCIAGIGAGGWLAILLGRFHMDITTCLLEWYNLTRCIEPKSKTEAARMRAFKNCYFSAKRLTEQIENLTEDYQTGVCLYEQNKNVRTRHVFVAALKSDNLGYNLFRTYEVPPWATKALEGPQNPEKFRMSHAFGVTGSAKYFSSPWEEKMSKSGLTRFTDSKFPHPHNITELALDEMWGIYGKEVQLSVVVNIGPGLPSHSDITQIARRFSWQLESPRNPTTYSKRQRSLSSDPTPTVPATEQSKSSNLKTVKSKVAKHMHFSDNTSAFFHPFTSPKTSPKPVRVGTFGSIHPRRVEDKLQRYEIDIEQDIKKKLNHVYPQGSNLYFRLAPEEAPKGTAQNDHKRPGVALNSTREFLRGRKVKGEIERCVKNGKGWEVENVWPGAILL